MKLYETPIKLSAIAWHYSHLFDGFPFMFMNPINLSDW
jgi:hypothetical protein